MRKAPIRATASLAVAAAVVALPAVSAGAGLRPSSVSSFQSSSVVVRVQQKLAIMGTVRPRLARPVVVQRRLGTTWVRVARTRSNIKGQFATSIPTNMYVGTARYRLLLPVTKTHQQSVSVGKTITIKGGGMARSHTYLFDEFNQEPLRWDPCKPITYQLNIGQAPAGTAREVEQALDRFTAQAGFHFRYLGTTKHIPKQYGDNPRGTDLVIAAIRPDQSPHLPHGPAGVGGAVGAYEHMGDQSFGYLKHGFVLLNASIFRQLDPGFTAGRRYGWAGTRGQLLMHEIGHAMGLGHANSDRRQVMYSVMQERAAIWGNGDAAGFDRLGIQQGCLFPTGFEPGAAQAANAWADAGIEGPTGASLF